MPSAPKRVLAPSSYSSTLAQIKEIEDDPVVSALIREKLPPNYDFEIGKTIWRIRNWKGKDGGGCKTVALQFPEGLLIFSTRIGSILSLLTSVDIILMGDITYGACCIDDYTASMLGADLLVHYGHSCLVPTVVANKLDTIYVFVSIKYNLDVGGRSIGGVVREWINDKKDRKKGSIKYDNDDDKTTNISLVSTIQFANSLGDLKSQIEKEMDGSIKIEIPRSKPLSKGEILGCTAPTVPGCDLIVYVGDGRFHLEAMMMANPGVDAFRYDPYNTTTTFESFNHSALSKTRSSAISKLTHGSKRLGLILGTLGRQGNPKPLEHVYDKINSCGNLSPFVLLMSEVMPAKLEMFGDGVDGWVQFACPRLSIDWGEGFKSPVLSSYEAVRLVGEVGKQSRDGCCSGGDCCGESYCYSHPMDYYSYESGGGHTPNFGGGVVNKVVKK